MAKKDRIRVSFGHNAENVTGSYTLIECGSSGKTILVDFGMIQENTSLLKEYQMNAKRPDFKIKDVDYIFVTHAHIDHSGRLPMLYRYGCEAPIFIPEGSKELYEAMIMDSVNIVQKDAGDLTKKLKKEYEPFYDEEDATVCFTAMEECRVGEKIQLDDNITFQLNYNAHIFKSVSITLWIKNGSQTRKIIITGDWGNLTNKQKFTEEFVQFDNCNLLIGEATYADNKRQSSTKDRIKDYEKIKAAVDTVCRERKGRILIPTFAFGRTPTMLATFYDIFHEDETFDIPVYYASPLGVKLLNIFLKELDKEQSEYLKEVLAWDKLKVLNSFEEFDKIIKDNSPKIVLAPSGMMQAGYSCYAATVFLPHSADMIMFCGYSAEGSLSRKIKDKKTKTITIDGKVYHSRCQVCTLNSFSSHAQKQDLISIYSGGNTNYDKIALVHSDLKGKTIFCKELQEELSKRNKATKVICVNNSTTITL